MNRKMSIFTTVILLATANTIWAHAHVHIGRNKDQTVGTSDDNKLFLFGMPPSMQPEDYWPAPPAWGDASDPYNMTREPLKLVYQETGILGGKYLCEYLYCFHSAHPDHGNWQLGGANPNTQPDWSIAIQRVSASAGLIFKDMDTLVSVLENNGDTVEFTKDWFTDKANENGTPGAWGFHHHVMFVVDGADAEIGDTFSATFRALDNDTAGFEDSEAYTLQFVTVPEPATLLLTALGSLSLLRKRKQ